MPPSDPLARFLAGGLAGAVSRTATAPLERLRTMMMADAANARLAPTLRKMWASGGLLGLWRGNLASVVKIVPQSAIQFAVGRPRWCNMCKHMHTCLQDRCAQPQVLPLAVCCRACPLARRNLP